MFKQIKEYSFISVFIMMGLLLSSCIGVVEDGIKSSAISTKYNSSTLRFDGVQEVIGISHNKMEVYFFPAEGGSGKYTYKIYYGGEPIPQVVSSDVLNIDYTNKLRFTLTGLQEARNYIVRVDVEDQITHEVTTTTNTLSDSTYDTKVADFYGISHVSNLSGIDGLDSIRVRWTHAECIDAMRCDQDSDPKAYEIILLDQTNMGLNPSSFDEIDFGPEDGRIVKQIPYSTSNNENEALIRGLRSNTMYYVLVRAIHQASIDDINNMRLRGESNHSYLTIMTLNDDLSEVDYDTDSLEIQRLSGTDATTGIKALWKAAIGVFDHYRLYYAPEGAGLSSSLPSECKSVLSPVDDPNLTKLCKEVNYSEVDTIVAGLLPQTNYEFILVVCATGTCNDGERIVGNLKTGTTVASPPTFGGISLIGKATDISEFGSLNLIFNGVDPSVTYIDGYVVGFKSDPSNEVIDYIEITSAPQSGLTDLYVEPYDPFTADSIRVRGVEYYSNETYCFKVFPFVYNAYGNRDFFENEKWECINNPDYVAPTQVEFPGLKTTRTEGRQVTLRWDAPMSGVYENYELYYVNTADGALSFSAAMDALDSGDNSTYGRIVLNASEGIEITLTDFGEGESYSFGILTVYNSTQGKLRSEANLNIVTCTFSEGNNIDCNGGR